MSRRHGDVFLMKKEYLKPQKVKQEPIQRIDLFQIMCKSSEKCCKLMVDSDSRDNLVALKTVEKIKLKRMKHLKP